MKIYTIRDKTSGLYSSGSLRPTFGKVGKVWNTRGKVSSHLSQFLSYSGNFNIDTKEWVVYEYDLDSCSVTDTFSAYDYICRKRNLRSISKNYGSSVSILVDKLEKSKEISEYRWAAIVEPDSSSLGESKTLPHFIRGLNLSSKEFRYSSADKITTVGFRSKHDLLMFKLAYLGSVQFIDLNDVTIFNLT